MRLGIATSSPSEWIRQHMAWLPPPCGSTQPLHPLGVQPEEQLIAERYVAKVVKVLLKARDAVDLNCDRVERLDLDVKKFEGRGGVAESHALDFCRLYTPIDTDIPISISMLQYLHAPSAPQTIRLKLNPRKE